MSINKPLVITQFLLWCQGGHSKDTVKSYSYALNAFVQYLIMIKKEAIDCTITDLSSYALWLENKGLRGSTRQTYLGALRTLWNWLYRQKLVGFSEDLIPVPKDRSDSEPYPYLSTQDFHKMAYSFREFNPVEIRNKAIMFFLYFTGTRVGEMCSIDTADINTFSQRGETKTFKRPNHRRFIYWDQETNRLLCKWLDLREQFLRHHGLNSNALWITMDSNNPGERIKKGAIERLFRTCRENLHIDKQYTPHSCRHGFGHNMMEKMVNLRHLQEMMGHAKITTTQIYMQVEHKDVEKSYRMAIN